MSNTPALDVTPPAIEASAMDPPQSDRPSRSVFKNLFSRRRLSPSPTIITHTTNSTPQGGLLPSQRQDHERLSVHPRNLLSPRSNADNGVLLGHSPDPTSRARSKSPSHTINNVDSRTFHHAYSRATVRASLQVPVKGFFGRMPLTPSLRPGTATADVTPSSSRRNSAHGVEASGSEHQVASIASSGSFADKIFVLETGGVILQFKVDGAPDRLPEKTVQLTAESIVFPSDAIPGKPTVLELSTIHEVAEHNRPKTNRSTWTRNPFRASVSRRSSENLLIVFEDADSMSIWMSAIRREIDQLGRGANRPLSARDLSEKQLPALRSASTERFSLRQSFLHLSRSTSSLRNDAAEPVNTSKELPHLPLPPAYQRTMSSRSCAASSVATTTSLDRLRESDTGSMTTGATNSLDGSFTLESPVKESFANMASPVYSPEPLTSPLSECHNSRPSSMNTKTIRERRKSSVGQLRLQSITSAALPSSTKPAGAADKVAKPIEVIPTTEMGEGENKPENGRPLSIVPPLPSPDDIKRPSHMVRTRSVDCVADLDQTRLTNRPASSHVGHRPRPSADASKSMYSLFPKKRVEQPKAEPLVVADMNSIPGLSQTHATDHLELPPTPTVAVTPAAGPSQPKMVSKRPSPLKLLAPFDADQPMRSPAVTDDMLATNFGTLGSKPLLSPVSPQESRVPSFDDLKFDFSFLRQDAPVTQKRRSKSPSSDHSDSSVRRRKSTPSLRVSRAPAAPVGPPPSGPLPAVPVGDSSSTQSTTSPDKRASDRPKSGRPTNSPPRPPSAFAKPKPSSQSLPQVPAPDRNSIPTQEKPVVGSTSPLAPVGMPSIITPPVVPVKMHNRSKSSGKSSSSFQTHRRAKSSGKYSIGANIRGFPPAPILCDSANSYLC